MIQRRQQHSRYSIFILGMLAISILNSASAVQAEQTPDRPKIGLALGGGGARGFAHVGVLKVLEELRIPIDYIAGTSMGSIIGGLYASGMSADEITQIIARIDWNDLLDDTPLRKTLIFRRKMDYDAHLLDFEMGFRKGRFVIPKGLVVGQKLRLMLQIITLPASSVNDFSQLPIPFCAVATDIETGEIVALNQGDLAEAMNASMAIPGVLAPVEINGRLLIDGGVVSNVPVDAVRNMGADVVIAVDVSKQLASRKEIESISGISKQYIDVMMRNSVLEEVKTADLVITPDVKKYSFADFERSAEIITAGVDQANVYKTDLERYSVNPEIYSKFKTRCKLPSFTPERIAFVNIANTARVDSRIIKRRIQTRPGDKFEIDSLRNDLSHLYELGDYERVDFRLIDSAEGTGLLINAQEKSWGPNFIRFGVTFSDDTRSNSYFNLFTRFTMTRLNRLAAEWRTDIQYGRTRRLFSEFFQPINIAELGFISPSIDIENRRIDIYSGNHKTAEYDATISQGFLHVGSQLGAFGEFRAGLRLGYASADVAVGTPQISEYKIRIGGYHARFIIDQLDNIRFPHDAALCRIDLYISDRSFGADDSYAKLSGKIEKFVSFRNNIFFGAVEGASNIGTTIPDYDLYSIGGLFSFSGFKEGQLRDQLYGIARFGYLRQMKVFPAGFSSGIYLGGWVESGNVWPDPGSIEINDLHYAGTLAIGADLPFGPLFVAYGATDNNNSSAYISLGYSF